MFLSLILRGPLLKRQATQNEYKKLHEIWNYNLTDVCKACSDSLASAQTIFTNMYHIIRQIIK